jgi:hypothetical protein
MDVNAVAFDVIVTVTAPYSDECAATEEGVRAQCAFARFAAKRGGRFRYEARLSFEVCFCILSPCDVECAKDGDQRERDDGMFHWMLPSNDGA